MPSKKNVVFRIDPNDWERFKKLARKNKVSASSVLVGFIQSCLESGTLPSQSGTLPPNWEERVRQIAHEVFYGETYQDGEPDKIQW